MYVLKILWNKSIEMDILFPLLFMYIKIDFVGNDM